MNKTEILVVGNKAETVKKTVRMLKDRNEWNGIEALTDEDAVTKFQQYQIDIVLLEKDITDVQERKLRKLFSFQSSSVVITRVESDDEATLHTTINALEKEKAGKEFSFAVIDDALKNAGLNIQVQ